MAPKIVFTFLILSLIFKVYASQQPTIHYIVTSPQPSTAQAVPASPKPTTSLSSLASLASLLSSGVPTSAPSVPPTSVPSGLPTSLASLLTGLPTKTAVVPARTVTPPAPAEKPPSNGVEMELLNNLAIALQLMIVNNILASPQQDTSSSTDTTPNSQKQEDLTIFPAFDSFDPPLSYAPVQNNLPPIVSQYQPYQPYDQQNNRQYNQMPNANYVGSSGFGNGNPLMSTVPPPMPTRSGLTLMSPYEALSPSSPYMDPILSSPYGSVMMSKHDFQSPYASILGSDNKDIFSMSSINDLF